MTSNHTLPDTDLFNMIMYGSLNTQVIPIAPSTVWIADIGASHHYCNDRTVIADFHAEPMPVYMGTGYVMPPGYGTVLLSVWKSTGDFQPLKLHNVRYLPHNRVNTISEDLLEWKDVYWQGQIQQFIHMPSGSEFASCQKENGMKIFEV
jgi:hypothetical protein